MLALGAADVHVWLADPNEVTDPAHQARCLALLSADERAQHARFHFARDRHLYLVAHALVRCTLSRYAAVAPAAWRFVATPHGRPELAPGVCPLPLRFNLSHTHGQVAVAVTLVRDVGVDVESHDRPGDPVASAADYFAPAELDALRALPAAARTERFFVYWTLKEAYIKARGLGLSLPLELFAFDVADPGPIAVAFTPPLVDDPAAWHFERARPTPRHFLACAARRLRGEAVRLRVRTTSPLAD